MPTKIYIYGEGNLPTGRGTYEFDLYDDLRNFLHGRGEIIFDDDDDGHQGRQWNVDLLLHEDADDVDGWIQRLTAFLRQWGVKDRILSFTIIRDDALLKWEHRRVELVSE